MRPVYLDNAATSYPKPPCVAEAMLAYMRDIGASINRGGYARAYAAEEMVFDTRERLARLFHAADCRSVIFTQNVTESLNLCLLGLLAGGDHVLVSQMEHNAVMRPLSLLAARGVSVSTIPCDAQGRLDTARLPLLLQKNTRAVIMTHASNVCGTILPLRAVGDFCRAHGLFFIVDAAQTAGLLPIDMQALSVDALCFTGHKALLGPQGIGGFVLSPRMAAALQPVLAGGTGSMSDSAAMPPWLPDRFEPGTPNLPGIAGLNAALRFIEETGMESIFQHEIQLTRQFLDAAAPLAASGRIRLIGLPDACGRTGVVSVQTLSPDCAEAAALLDTQYGVMTRVGLLCAPCAHRALGTFPVGTIRFSFGLYNTPEEIDRAAQALTLIAKRG